MRVRWLDRRTRMLAQRPWTDRERRVVRRGLEGRLAIAVEPLLGTTLFALFTWGIVWRAHHVPGDGSLIVLTPIFGLGAVAFLVYAIVLMIAPLRAYLQTFKPIYIVDGYIRYRGRDARSSDDACGYIAVLFEDKSVACEWECYGDEVLPEATIPALAEFSLYGGIHKIDGKPTGVLPEDLPPLAIGIAPRR